MPILRSFAMSMAIDNCAALWAISAAILPYGANPNGLYNVYFRALKFKSSLLTFAVTRHNQRAKPLSRRWQVNPLVGEDRPYLAFPLVPAGCLGYPGECTYELIRYLRGTYAKDSGELSTMQVIECTLN